MIKTIKLIHDYSATSQQLWEIAVNYDCLREVMKGLVAFTGVPHGLAKTGQKLNIEVSLFGILPDQPYYMEILECDHEKRILRSYERGAGVKSWVHTLSIEETKTGARLIDEISIDAGVLTPLFSIWARYMYKARHKPRLRLLSKWSSMDAP